jgi:hypothetical protein
VSGVVDAAVFWISHVTCSENAENVARHDYKFVPSLLNIEDKRGLLFVRKENVKMPFGEKSEKFLKHFEPNTKCRFFRI